MENSDRAIDAVMENENGEKVESAHRQESKSSGQVQKNLKFGSAPEIHTQKKWSARSKNFNRKLTHSNEI